MQLFAGISLNTLGLCVRPRLTMDLLIVRHARPEREEKSEGEGPAEDPQPNRCANVHGPGRAAACRKSL